MPQLEIATYASQIFWLAVIFVMLYIYLSRSSLPVIREVLQNRQSRIAGDLKKAETLKQDAEAASEDFTSVIAASRQRAHALIGDAKAKIAAEEAARNAKIDQNFAHQNKEAEIRVVVLRKEATEKLIPVAAAAAALMAEKMLGVTVDSAHAQSVALKVSKEIADK